MMKNFLIWLQAIGKWFFYEIRHVWFALVVIGLSFGAALILTSFYPAKHESIIRLTGLAFQIFGIGTVIWEINKTRDFLNIRR